MKSENLAAQRARSLVDYVTSVDSVSHDDGAAMLKLQPHAQRIGRNALRSKDVLTDNLGLALSTPSGAYLGTLWTYVGDGRWLSAVVSEHRDSAAALQAWAESAFLGKPPYRFRVDDPHIPLLGRGVFGAKNGAPRRIFVDSAAAQFYAVVLSLVETCRLQRRDPVEFLSVLL